MILSEVWVTANHKCGCHNVGKGLFHGWLVWDADDEIHHDEIGDSAKKFVSAFTKMQRRNEYQNTAPYYL